MLSSPSPTPAPARPERTRIKLKPADCQQAVTGGWWPRSQDLHEQLPALLIELRDRIGSVHRVEYNMTTWPAAPNRLYLDGRWIRLDGSLTQHPQSISLSGSLGRPAMTLLVVPVDTDPAVAEAALAVAATPGSGSSVSALLASAGVAVGGVHAEGFTRPRRSVQAVHSPGESSRALAAQAESSATAQSRAARTVASQADGVEDCRMLLTMLGLDGEGSADRF
jgi:hypothetical protein